ncbi:MAG: hypothetical protein V4670_01190 [Bacteroidota bacterium]
MFLKYKFILLFLVIFGNQIGWAQVNPKPKDTAKMYRDIEKYSKKRKFTKFVHKLIFEPVAKQKIKKHSFHKIKKQNYATSEGKIIREIKITTLDPFGYSETDTTLKPKQRIAKIGNKIHIKTLDLTIKNLLLIRKNTPLDSLLAKESERLIRGRHYIRGVKITTQLVSKDSDSVDVTVRVLDSWSLIPNFSTSGTKSTFELTEKNFLGSGHEFSNAYIKSLNSNRSAYTTSYSIPNIYNTFITTAVGYKVDLDRHYLKYIAVERPFFSPYARWGAGIYLDKQYIKEYIPDANQVLQAQNLKFTSQDYWAGHAFRVSDGNSEEDRTTNLITSARYYSKSYAEKPEQFLDSLGVFSDENLYLLGIGISSRKFSQDKYIFNYNIVEDVASGIIYNITTGYQKKNDRYKFYFGGRFALGKYYEFGYLSGNVEYGTFLKESKTSQSAINFSAVYFTNLYETGNWKFRQFIKPQFIIGNNRLNSHSDRLTLNENSGIQGFNQVTVSGTKKLLLTLQTQGYSPWRVLGFRLNPYLSCTMGMLGQENSGFRRSKVYSQFGAGIIISNDYLVFQTFQFSFSFYPNLPLDEGSLFKTNVLKTYDFGLQNFEISKPLMVPYK